MPYDTHEKSNPGGSLSRDPVAGKSFSVGRGFNALSYKHDMYSGAMDPLIMVDHFAMTEPTFGPHAHAGLSAVSILFEDSEGVFHNQDSLGNDIDLRPGDLYWLKAGRGAVHDEKPRPGGRTHALQVFVNLPGRMKYDAPQSLHVRASDMPTRSGVGYRARIMLGTSGDAEGQQPPALPMTILDLKLEDAARFDHVVPSGQAVFVLSIDGESEVQFGREVVNLDPKMSIALGEAAIEEKLVVTAKGAAHIVILQAARIDEPFVQRGPFAMSTKAEVDAMFAAHAAGQLGKIDD